MKDKKMKKLITVIFIHFLVVTLTFAQEKAFQIYSKGGNKISYKTMVFKTEKADEVLIGNADYFIVVDEDMFQKH